jgi:hypothetical protein
MKKVVADRVEVPYTGPNNGLRCLTTRIAVTQSCGVPRPLANRNGPTRRANAKSGLTDNERGAFDMAVAPVTRNPSALKGVAALYVECAA